MENQKDFFDNTNDLILLSDLAKENHSFWKFSQSSKMINSSCEDVFIL